MRAGASSLAEREAASSLIRPKYASSSSSPPLSHPPLLIIEFMYGASLHLSGQIAVADGGRRDRER